MKNVSRLGGVRWVALLAALVILGCTAVVPLWTNRAYAATGSMYLTGTNSAAHGGTVTLNLRINPGTAVTVTQSSITYDASKLQFVGINASGSAFDTNVTQSQSNGSIQIDRAKLDSAGVSTDSLIASITFTALPYSGSTAVSIVPPSNAAYNGSYTNPALSGASISFTSGSCSAGQTGTPPSCMTPPPASGGTTSGSSSSKSNTSSQSSGSSSSKPSSPTSTPAQTTPEAASLLTAPSIVSTDFQYTVAGIIAKTNVAAQLQVKYGLSADSLNFQTPLTASGTSHTITITENLPMATTVYYQLVATDGKATQATKTQTIKTKGVAVTVLLLDKNRNPIAGQTASIDNQQAKSSKDGYVTFNNLSPGEHQVVLKDGGKDRKQPFIILANITTTAGRQSTPDQNIFVVYDDYVPTGIVGMLLYVGGGIVLLVAAGAGVMYWRRNGGFWKHKTAGVPIEGLIVGGQGAPSKIPYDEPAYNPFEPHDSPSGSGK